MTTPAAAPAAPAAVAPAQPAVDSLLPADTGAAPAAPAASAAPAAAAPAVPAAPAAPAPEPTWFYADGAPGKGDAPEWYKKDKYKTVEEQAKAYPELEKRFGAFVGAPKEGKYAPPPVPEGLEGEFDTAHPIFDQFQKWAVEKQLSQEGYNEVLGLLAKYEASKVPDMGEIKKQIGDDADTRIGAVTQWAKANLPAENYGVLRAALSGENAADVFNVVEQLIAKTRVAVPKAGADVLPAAGLSTKEAIAAKQGKLGPDGKRIYDTDPKYRAEVENDWKKFYEAQGLPA